MIKTLFPRKRTEWSAQKLTHTSIANWFLNVCVRPYFLVVPHSMWDLSSLTILPTMAVWIFSLWTTREIPVSWFLTKMQRKFSEERIIFSTNGAKTIGYPNQKSKKEWNLDLYLISCTKIISECIRPKCKT